MKLIFCKECNDTFRLFYEKRQCKCGLSGGQYLDKINAIYWGEAIPLGFNNKEFAIALNNQPKEEGRGLIFESFVIPEKCSTFKKQ